MHDVGSLLSVVRGAAGTFLKNSAIAHKYAGHGVFSGCPIEARNVVGYTYRSFVYADHGRKKQLKKTYEEGVMMVITEQFSKWAFKISNTIVDKRGEEQATGIIPALFSACGTATTLGITWERKLLTR